MARLAGKTGTAAEDNVIQGSGIAQFAGRRWVEVHAFVISLNPGDGDVVFANGQITMARFGFVPAIAKGGDGSGANKIPSPATKGFSEATKIFEGWVTATKEAELVLQLPASRTTGDTYDGIYWSFEHRSQP